MENNKWDKNVPVELSSYLHDDEIVYFNEESFNPNPSKLKMLDLFCGAGGFSVGCEWAGFQSVFGVDHLAPAIKTWAKNHPNAIACLGDIRKIDPVHIKELLESRGVSKINLITAGVPC